MFKKIGQGLLLTSLLLALPACQNTYLSQKPEAVNHLEFINTGDILPIDSIRTIDDKLVNLHLLGKKKLVILFATWCSDSNRLISALNNSPLLNDEGIEVIAIAREEDEKTVKAWREARNIKVPLAVDVDRSLYKLFASGGIPRIITVGENNKIIKMNLAEGSDQLAEIVW